jgi:hypothetical protein
MAIIDVAELQSLESSAAREAAADSSWSLFC